MKILIYNGSQKMMPTFIMSLSKELKNSNVEVAIGGRCNRIAFYREDGILRIPTGSDNLLWLALQVFFFSICLFFRSPLKYYIALCCSVQNKKWSGKFQNMVLFCAILIFNPDIVHIQWALRLSLFTKILPYKLFKTIVSFRGTQINVTPWIDEKVRYEISSLLPLADGYHAVSERILKKAELLGAVRRRAAVIYPAVADAYISHNVKIYSQHRERLEILSVGHNLWIKGYVVAIHACKILKERGIPFHYTIIAGGDKTEVKFQIYEFGLQNEITLVDRIPHEKVMKYQRNADVFLLSSIEEGIANVVLEAMALYTPVISTDCGGMSEIIQNGVNGILVPTHDPLAIANALEQFDKMNNQEIEKMVVNAMEIIKKKHLVSYQIGEMIKLYENTLKTDR